MLTGFTYLSFHTGGQQWTSVFPRRLWRISYHHLWVISIVWESCNSNLFVLRESQIDVYFYSGSWSDPRRKWLDDCNPSRPKEIITNSVKDNISVGNDFSNSILCCCRSNMYIMYFESTRDVLQYPTFLFKLKKLGFLLLTTPRCRSKDYILANKQHPVYYWF